MSNEDLVLPHDPNTGFLRGNPAAVLPVAQTLAQIETLNRNIQGLVDLIQRNAQAAASSPAAQPATNQATPAEPPIARVSRPSDPANPSPPASTTPVQRPTRDMTGRMMGASASGEDSNPAGHSRADYREDSDSNRGFFESLLERFEQVTSSMTVPDQIDPTVGAFREITAPLKLLGSMGGSPADKKQFSLAQRTLKFLGAWRKESKTQQDETQDAIRASQNRQSRSSLMNGIKIAAMTPRLLALLPAALKAAAVAAAAKAAKEIGEKANEVLASTDTGQRILDGIGEAGTHVAAAFGNKQAIDVIAENLRLEQEQLANGAGKPTTSGSPTNNTQTVQNGKDDYQLMTYDAFRKQGLSDSQAVAMTAEVGRENDFRTSAMFGTHTDLANNAQNLGILSWQGDRKEKLVAHLRQKSLIGQDGKIVQGQAALDAMAEFAVNEIKTNPQYAITKRDFLDNPSIDAEAAAPILGKNYVRWAYGQDKLKSGKPFPWKAHDQKRRQYRQSTEQKTQAPQMAAPPITTPATQNRIENFKPMRLVEDTIQPAPKLHLPQDSAELSKHAESLDRPAPNVPQQQSRSDQGQSSENWYDQHLLKGVGQNVEDRLIAHAITGGIGWKT